MSAIQPCPAPPSVNVRVTASELLPQDGTVDAEAGPAATTPVVTSAPAAASPARRVRSAVIDLSRIRSTGADTEKTQLPRDLIHAPAGRYRSVGIARLT